MIFTTVAYPIIGPVALIGAVLVVRWCTEQPGDAHTNSSDSSDLFGGESVD